MVRPTPDSEARSGEAFRDEALQRRLQAGCRVLACDAGIPPDWPGPGCIPRLLDYLAELSRWNRAYNLTAVTDPAEMVDRHLLDSLSVWPHLRAGRILDAGTGAGLPGVPLAIACPDRHFILLDSNGKKIRFLNHLRRTLGLDNIEPVQGRLESAGIDPPPGEILARALAPLPKLVAWTERWLDGGARLLAMKADLGREERNGVPDAYNVAVETLNSPDPAARRCLVIVTKAAGART